jgi:hypothetical protein
MIAAQTLSDTSPGSDEGIQASLREIAAIHAHASAGTRTVGLVLA